jgi:spore germination protein (amino acid permease)
MRRVQISGGLLACLLAIVTYIAQVLFLPRALAQICGQDAWLAVIIGGAGGTLIALMATWASVRHPRQGPAQIARSLLGKWAGGAFGLIYTAFFAGIFSLVLRNILDFTTMALLPGTPGRVIVSLFAAVALYGASQGLEPIARVSFQVMAALAAAVIVAPLLEVREFRLLQVDPFLYRGIGAVLKASMISMSWFGDSIVVMTLVPHLKHPQKAYPWVVAGMAGGTLIWATTLAMTVFVLGPNLPGRFLFPVYTMVQLIAIAKIVERIEVLMVTIWLSGMWVRAAFYLFAAAEAAAQTLGLKSHRWPAVVLAVAGALLTQIWTSTIDLVHVGSTPAWNIGRLAIEIGLPTLLLVASFLQMLFRGVQPARG